MSPLSSTVCTIYIYTYVCVCVCVCVSVLFEGMAFWVGMRENKMNFSGEDAFEE